MAIKDTDGQIQLGDQLTASKNIVLKNDPVTGDIVFVKGTTGGTQTEIGRFYNAGGNTLEVNVKQFGAVGDGITNDSPAFLLAKAAVPFGGTLHLEPNKTYLLNTKVSLGNIGKLDGHGSTVKFTQAALSTYGFGLSLGDLYATFSAFTPASAVTSSNKFTIPSGVTLVAGDLICMLSTDVRVENGSSDYYHGMWAKVVEITADVAYISSAFYGSFSITSIEVYRVPEGATVTGVNFDLSLAPSTLVEYTEGLRVTGINTVIEKCSAKGNQYAHIAFSVQGTGAYVRSNNIDYFLNTQYILPGSPSRIGYGVAIGANDCVVENNIITRCKHAITAPKREFVITNPIVRGNSIVEDYANHVTHQYSSSVDAHSNVSGSIIIETNSITCYANAFGIRNGAALIKNNLIVQAGAANTIVTGQELPFAYLKFIGNKVYQFGASSCIVGNYSTSGIASFSDVTIKDNTIYTGRVVNFGLADTIISNMDISGNTTYNQDVLTVVSGTGVSVEKMNVSDNIVLNANGLFSFSIASSANTISNISVKRNKFTSVSATTTDAVLMSVTTSANYANVDISDNTLDLTSHSAASGYAFQILNATFNNLKLNGNITYTSSTRGMNIGRGTFTQTDIKGNYLNGSDLILGSSATSCTFTDLLVTQNKVGTIYLNEATTDLTFIRSKFTENTTDSLQVLNRTGSGGWAASTPMLVANNIFTSGSNPAISINANGTGNKVKQFGNICGVKPNDASSTYFGTPIGNTIVSGANQTWKGATTINENGDISKASIPTTGTWVIGDRVFNSAPAVGQPKSWVRITTGSGNVLNTDWVSEGNL